MRNISENNERRYQVLDDLIQQLSASVEQQSSDRIEPNGELTSEQNIEPGIKLMCDFWDILKENPECDLKGIVEQNMRSKESRPPSPSRNSNIFSQLRNIKCFMAQDVPDRNCCTRGKQSNSSSRQPSRASGETSKGSSSKYKEDSFVSFGMDTSKSKEPSTDELPLSKVLGNLKEAASHDKKCCIRLKELLEAEKKLQQQINILEEREKQGVVKLEQADAMWTSMEDAYKTKIAQSLERQKELLKELKEVETSAAKWRKNKKGLEVQIDAIQKCHIDISQKINQKKNDKKALEGEVAGYKTRIEANRAETMSIKKNMGSIRKASDCRLQKIATEVIRLEKALKGEKDMKDKKESEGNHYIQDARDDLQKICKELLQKKLEREDLFCELQALTQEIELLKTTCDSCKDRCKKKEDMLDDEIKRVETEIAKAKVQCLRCHACTDTGDARKLCTDCPRCVEERQCLIEGDECSPNVAEDCVCEMVKRKFLENVFENMYIVLEKQTDSPPGKGVAQLILNCLKNSRNGKISRNVRNILQEFVLTVVKKNLNLTIVGGAVKTRCEMDPETYKQLMLCLTKVKTTKTSSSSKGTAPKPGPCDRWGGATECFCPKGPKTCVCVTKAPPKGRDGKPCPPDKEDEPEPKSCPSKKDTKCGPDCAQFMPSKVAADVNQWRPDPCSAPSCPFSRNMRAAQCVLGPDQLAEQLSREIMNTSRPIGLGSSSRVTPKSSFPEMTLPSSMKAKSSKDVCLCKNTRHPCDTIDKQLKADVPCECVEEKNVTSCYPAIGSLGQKSFTELGKKETQKSVKINTKHQETNKPNKGYKVELVKTPNEVPGMSVGDSFADMLDTKLKNDSNLSLFLKKSDSKNYVVYFEPDQNLDVMRMQVKKSVDGELFLVMYKNLSKYLEPVNSYGSFTEDPHFNCNEDYNKERSAESALILKIFRKQPHSTKRYSQKWDTESTSKQKKIAGKKFQNALADIIREDEKKMKHFHPCQSCKNNARKNNPEKNSKTKLFNVTAIGNLVNVRKLPAVLEMTSSGNFNFVLDKEYEKHFNRASLMYLKGNTRCFVEVQKKLDTILINFISERNKQNALLTKDSSRNFRVLKNGPEFVTLSKNLTQKQSAKASRVFEDFLCQVTPRISCDDHKVYDNAGLKKSLSDSCLHQELDSQDKSFLKKSFQIQRTPSGQFEVVLKKDSKVTFFKALKKYLAANKQGTVPITKSNSGNILIVLDPIAEKQSYYGSLKITQSGNIYVIMDEKVAKRLSNTGSSIVCEQCSFHIINKIRNPADKAVATNCRAHPDGCLCDLNKCVCKKILECAGQDKTDSCIASASSIHPDSDNPPNRKVSLSIDLQKCLKPCSANTKNDCQHDAKFDVNEQCYYMVDSKCQSRTNKLSAKSTESPERQFSDGSGSGSVLGDLPIYPKIFTNNTSNYGWNYLPPQLPSFLSDPLRLGIH